MPRFDYETDWLKLPPDMTMGEVSAVAVDGNDHLWVLHRPRSVPDDDAGQTAPPIIEFDAQGRYLRGFGGLDDEYEWPDVEHSLAVGANGHVWVGGSYPERKGRGDDMLLEFDNAGSFVRQIGRRGAGTGNCDRENFRAPADIYVDDANQEIYVADGYGNQRVVVVDAQTGKFKRMWGAYGAMPPPPAPECSAPDTDTPPLEHEGSHSFNGLHGVEVSRDGRVYVSDRMNQRIQVFSRQGDYIGQIAVNPGLASPLTASGMTFSTDPQQSLLYVIDFGNAMIVVIDRHKMKVIGKIGGPGKAAGEFTGPHLIDIDSKGVLYIAEVQGRRLQRLVPAE